MTDKLVEYLDWSDKGQDRHEAGQAGGKFGTLSVWTEDDSGCLALNVRRGTKAKRDLTVYLKLQDARELYDLLREHFGD